MEGEFAGEGQYYGEGGFPQKTTPPPSPLFAFQEPKEKILTLEEASRCLNTLGKDESGVRYAYLKITATERGLTDVSVIVNYKHIFYVDLSGNFLNLDALQVVSKIPYLLYLKAERNKVESAALSPMSYLQVLILNKNQITETCDISQPILETLELGANSIYTVQFDSERLPKVKELSLHQNRIIDTSGTYPIGLEKLYLGQNRISKITMDICKLTNLKILHLRSNYIRKLSSFSEVLSNLTYVNLRDNKINKVRQFRKLACLPKLDTLIILENPLYKRQKEGSEEETEAESPEEELEGDEERQDTSNSMIKLEIIALLPNLIRLNKELISEEEREVARAKRRFIMTKIFEEDSSEEETEISTTDFTTDFTTETEDMKSSGVRLHESREELSSSEDIDN